MLLVTGRPVGRPNHLYLFPQADEDKPAVELSDQDVLSYQEDWENRKNVLGRANFWALPRAGEEKPVFYLRHEGHTYFGMSLFLRIGYGRPLSQGLPQRHLDAPEGPGVDYPHGILGFAGPDGAYRSRVSFGDFPAVGQVEPEPPLGAVLAGPKPSYYPGYVAEGKNYAQEGFRLRGYKQYWLKEPGKVPAGKREGPVHAAAPAQGDPVPGGHSLSEPPRGRAGPAAVVPAAGPGLLSEPGHGQAPGPGPDGTAHRPAGGDGPDRAVQP